MSIERIELQPGYSISKIIKGGWHLAGGHGAIDESTALDDMLAFVKSGITTFDCADIYTGVETLIGKFRKKQKEAFTSGALPPIQIHTKYVPDYDALATLNKYDIEKTIDRSLLRLGVERLDLVQFAWWDYSFPRYLDTALHLKELQTKGKIRFIGITNFDAAHASEILEAGVNVVSNQVQYSVLDQRVESDYADLKADNIIPYLCYGVIAGGFLSNRYLNVNEPKAPLENRSLTKYRLIIEEFGSYESFKNLLKTLEFIGQKYEQGVAEVAAKYVLQKDHVAAIIVGARNAKHIDSLSRLSNFNLAEDDLLRIEDHISKANGPRGPFYALERNKTGKHGSIMKYNLNTD